MNATINLAVSVAMMFWAGASIANDAIADAKPMDAEAAFEALKSFEGTWKGEALVVPAGEDKKDGVTSDTTVTYKVIANESSVMASYAVGTPMEMVSMYHLDGPAALVHTHYCAVGNQPTMRFEKTSEPNTIRFEFAAGTNLDVTKDGHVHGGTIRIIDEDTIETETDIWQGGKTSSIRYATLKRTK